MVAVVNGDSYWLLLAPLPLIAAAGCQLYRCRRQQRLLLQAEGLERLQRLRQLLANIQRHRGMTAAYLNGDTAVLTAVQGLQQHTTEDIAAVSKVFPALEADNRWQNITQHWARLSANFAHNSSDNNLQQHAKLIQSLLLLIDQLAEYHLLLRLKTGDSAALRYIWKELLTAAECIGQARALGTGVATAGYCKPEDRRQLHRLHGDIDRALGLAWRGLPSTQKQRQLAEQLLQCIDGELVAQPDTDDHRVSVCARQYFKLCSDTMDSIYQQYDQAIDRLRFSR